MLCETWGLVVWFLFVIVSSTLISRFFLECLFGFLVLFVFDAGSLDFVIVI